MKSILWRLIRGTVATAVSTGLATLQAQPHFVWLTPIILALGKALRDKFPKQLGWLPI